MMLARTGLAQTEITASIYKNFPQLGSGGASRLAQDATIAVEAEAAEQ